MKHSAMSSSSAEPPVADERIPVHLDNPEFDDYVEDDETYNEEMTPESMQAEVRLDAAISSVSI